MLTVENTLKWLELFDAKIQAEKDYLSELDTPIGDGDHGNNMSRGLLAVHDALTKQQPTDVQGILKTTAMMLISKSWWGFWSTLWDSLFRNGKTKQYDT